MAKVYRVYGNQGQGGVLVHTVSTLEQALKYVQEHRGEMSYAIKLPDGAWYQW